jgi:hypothetical protein
MNMNRVRIVESAYLVVDGKPYTARRSWRERLISRPWRPFVASRVVVPKVPHPGAVQIGPDTFLMHPETARKVGKVFPA